MGKKRIAIIDDSSPAKEKKKPKEKGLPASRQGQKIVKTGKEHGRIADMGAIALEEAAKIKEQEEKLEKEALKKVTKKAKRPKKKPAKKRGKRYQDARKKVDRTKFYPLSEAVKLAKTTSISRFNGAIEVHLSTHQAGLKGTVKFPHSTGKSLGKVPFHTETKAPLIHMVIGKVDSKEKDLEENFKALIKAIGKGNIRKTVLTSTMGPGIKVAIDNL